MKPLFIRQPNLLFIRFEGYTGPIIFSHLPLLHTIIHFKVASFPFKDLLDIIVYPSKLFYIKLLRAFIGFSKSFIHIGLDFDYYEDKINPIYGYL